MLHLSLVHLLLNMPLTSIALLRHHIQTDIRRLLRLLPHVESITISYKNQLLFRRDSQFDDTQPSPGCRARVFLPEGLPISIAVHTEVFLWHELYSPLGSTISITSSTYYRNAARVMLVTRNYGLVPGQGSFRFMDLPEEMRCTENQDADNECPANSFATDVLSTNCSALRAMHTHLRA